MNIFIIAGSPFSETEVQRKVGTSETATTIISTTDNCDQNGVQLFVVQEHQNKWRFCNWKSSEKSFGKNLVQSFGYLLTFQVQWGSKYQTTVGIWNQETFEIQTFWRLDFKWLDFKWSCLSYGYSYHLKTGSFKSRRFDWISNGFWQNGDHLSRFQIPFEIRTKCNPTSFLTSYPD